MKTNLKVALGLVILLTTGCSTIHTITPIVSNYELIIDSSEAYVKMMKERIEKCKKLSDEGKECNDVNMNKVN